MFWKIILNNYTTLGNKDIFGKIVIENVQNNHKVLCPLCLWHCLGVDFGKVQMQCSTFMFTTCKFSLKLYDSHCFYNNWKHLQLGNVVERFKNVLETMPQLQLNNDVTKMKYLNKVIKYLPVFTTTTKARSNASV